MAGGPINFIPPSASGFIPEPVCEPKNADWFYEYIEKTVRKKYNDIGFRRYNRLEGLLRYVEIYADEPILDTGQTRVAFSTALHRLVEDFVLKIEPSSPHLVYVYVPDELREVYKTSKEFRGRSEKANETIRKILERHGIKSIFLPTSQIGKLNTLDDLEALANLLTTRLR